MKSEPLTAEIVLEAQTAVNQANGNLTLAAQNLGLPRSTLRARLSRAPHFFKERAVELPQFPDDDIPVEEILDGMSRRFEKRQTFQKSLRWFPIKFKTNDPIGLVFVGDPHVDDDGCNWPLLRKHVEIMGRPNVYAVNIGDTTNNWTGRLIKKFADQETSQATARKLAKWFLRDSKINWLAWLLGNHDAWNDGAAILKEMNIAHIPMTDWQAQFKLVFPDWECRIWAAHDFAGHSMWNSLHAAQKTAHMKDWAHIYACGHTHNWALHQEESASKDFIYWLVRSRGYKFIDEYADKHGHQPQKYGASIMAVIDPTADEINRIQCFADIERGAEFLKSLGGA